MSTYHSIGTLRYSPQSRDLKEGKWWCILDCDPEISRYYRSIFNHENRANFKIHAPAWGAHISIIANEQPQNNTNDWLMNSGTYHEYEYSGVIQGNGEYYWLNVICEPLLDLREQFGLKRNPLYPLHLTIGRIA